MFKTIPYRTRIVCHPNLKTKPMLRTISLVTSLNEPTLQSIEVCDQCICLLPLCLGPAARYALSPGEVTIK